MTEAKTSEAVPPEDEPQALVGFMSNDEWQDLLSDVNELVQEMEDLPFPQVKERVFLLLAGIDTIHREALRRLVRLFKEDVLEKVVTDPAIHTLMELYDMLPPNVKRAEPSEYKFEWSGSATKEQPASPGIPHWVPALNSADDLTDGSIRECEIDGRLLLLSRVNDAYFAFDSACVRDGASLGRASLTKYTLTCPHHSGCHYDIRDGGQIGGTKKIECYPVKREDNGRLMIGFDMGFRPELPAF